MNANEERDFIIAAVTNAKVPTVHPDAANTIDIGRAVLEAIRRTAAPVAEDVALPPKQSIDTPEFRAILGRYSESVDKGGYRRESDEEEFITARAALIAYIDGRTAGTEGDTKNA